MKRGTTRGARATRTAIHASASFLLIVAVNACATSPSPGTADTIFDPTTDRAGSDALSDHSGSTASQSATGRSAIQKAIAAQLENTGDGAPDLALAEFYNANDHRPIWFDDNGHPSPRSTDLAKYIDRVADQGLMTNHYLDSALAARLANTDDRDPNSLATDDIALSRAFVRLAHDLHRGRIKDKTLRAQWPTPNPSLDYQTTLDRAHTDDPIAALDGLSPQQPAYQALIGALADYRRIEDDGGWPTIGDGPVLKQDMQDPRIATLWRRLQITGDAPTAIAAPDRYGMRIMDAMRHYQKRNGLKVDGVLGPNTRAALNIPVARRIDEIKLNLERWRWMPDAFGDRYIAVNIPDYSLRAVNADGQSLSMPVIVGGSYDDRATPIFGDKMQYLVFRPYWNVPHGIAADEIVPKARRNPGYLASKNYQIVEQFGPNATPLTPTPAHIEAVAEGQLYIRQAGGASNALGLVKFIFPNQYAVYLHSTPAASLFDRNERDLSHGCVRVARPAALASFVLSGQPKWTQRHIDDAMHTGQRQRVNLSQDIPVYLMYWTAFVDNGTVNFRADLYDHDKELDEAFQALASRAS